jgi:hypothetical protein
MIKCYDWQDTALIASNNLRLLTWFGRRRPPRLSARSKLRRHVQMGNRSPFLRRTVGYPAFEERSVVDIATYFIGTQSQSFSERTSAQQAANEFVRNSDSKSVIVLPTRRRDVRMRIKR